MQDTWAESTGHPCATSAIFVANFSVLTQTCTNTGKNSLWLYRGIYCVFRSPTPLSPTFEIHFIPWRRKIRKLFEFKPQKTNFQAFYRLWCKIYYYPFLFLISSPKSPFLSFVAASIEAVWPSWVAIPTIFSMYTANIWSMNYSWLLRTLVHFSEPKLPCPSCGKLFKSQEIHVSIILKY